VTYYPDIIEAVNRSPKHVGGLEYLDCVAASVDLGCGAFVRFGINVEEWDGMIVEMRYTTNGCGFASAAAEMLSNGLAGRRLSDLHGFDETGVASLLGNLLDASPPGRSHCIDLSLDAIKMALAKYRERRLSRFEGDDPLICSCFGVSESTIEKAISDLGAPSIDQVTRSCNAGGGCGSCRMLIQEMIDGIE